MRHRTVFIVVVWIVVLFFLGFARSAAAQVTVQKRLTSSQQRDTDRIRELMNEVERLMKRLPPEVQADLKKQLCISPQAMKPVGPVGPVTVEFKDDSAVMAAAGGNKVMVLDLRGDDLDIGGRARINVRETGWTRSGTDDAFLMVSGASIRNAGFELSWASGGRVQDEVLVSDGLRVKTPDGKTHTIRDPLELLNLLDLNGDGKVDSSDPTWRFLFLFVDMNGDGLVDARELQSMRDKRVGSIAVVSKGSRKDSHGNRIADGVYVRIDETLGQAGVITLRRY
jgi:hypothetical protein